MKRLFLLVAVPLLATVGLAQNAPVPPDKAAGKMTVPDGFNVSLFAGEPDVTQPIAFAFDDRGRLWVVECLSYPNWTRDGKGKDRVVIFEDSKGVGKFDKRTVFYDKGVNLSGIQYGFGGIWLCSLPNIIFIPIKPGTDEPAGPPQIVLDGWNDPGTGHNAFNSLTWGPDGWLWGCNGIQANALVGTPGTDKKDRVRMNCGVWKYHPTKKLFEVVAHGTTNPWGLDFDEVGEAFITNCVIGHAWHVVPGADFQRMYGQPYNSHHYQLMETCADHKHWTGGAWDQARGGPKHDEAGGGHAHVGCMIYLGQNWPKEYRGNLFTLNLHGNRLNRDILERKGSGYVAKHGKDLLKANDPWFRGIALGYGPDGGVYVSDWCDTGECHNYKVVDRTNGRIFKITFGKVDDKIGKVEGLKDQDLANAPDVGTEWHARHAQRLLQERAVGKPLHALTFERLQSLAFNRDIVRPQKTILRALWTLHAINGLTEDKLLAMTIDDNEAVRIWAIRFALEDRKPSAKVLERLKQMAVEEKSPAVRMNLASGLQRIPLEQRWPIAEDLVKHADDAKDKNHMLLLWYGIEPLVPADSARAARLISSCQIPLIREFLARRIASLGD